MYSGMEKGTFKVRMPAADFDTLIAYMREKRDAEEREIMINLGDGSHLLLVISYPVES